MRLAALFVLALAAAGCQSPEEQLEDEVRNLLSDRGNVQEAELAEGEDGNMTGHATVAAANGESSRYNCSATKADGTRYNINCIPAIDEAQLRVIEADIRRAYAQQGAEVLEVDMQKHNDDNNVRGFVRARDVTGDVRLTCTGRRDLATNQFPWQCERDGAAAAGAQPAMAGTGGKDTGGGTPGGGETGDGEVLDGEVVDGEGGK